MGCGSSKSLQHPITRVTPAHNHEGTRIEETRLRVNNAADGLLLLPTKVDSCNSRPVTSSGTRPRTGRPRTAAGRKDGSRDSALQSEQHALLAGDVTRKEYPSFEKIVRIFVSSTFTDTKLERNTMMAKVFPNLMQKCQEKGYQFQIVDMRWGVRDEATDDHRTTDLCLREIELCKKISTGPCFMTLVSHKYGYRNFPRELDVSEFEHILDPPGRPVASESERELFKKWFKEDKNSKPPKYVLLPISTHYDMGRDKDREKWREECERMQKIMLRSTGKPLESVTEAEIRCALLADQKTAERGIWFYRKFTNISGASKTAIKRRFRDYYDNDEGKKKESRELLQQLKDDMRGVQGDKKKKDQSVIRLPEANCKKIKIRWDKKQGVNPAVKEHEQYLKEMCKFVEGRLWEMIEQAVRAREVKRPPPELEEVTHHLRFCKEKCDTFRGRQKTLEEVSKYLRNDSRRVYVVHGRPGCGKTSVVAMAAREAWTKRKEKGAVILRFLGTTLRSSNVANLLSSIILQLKGITEEQVSEQDVRNLPTKLKDLVESFHKEIEEKASEDFPVTLLLDSLDQLNPENGALQLTWLPIKPPEYKLPEHVKVIVSTLPDNESFPRLKGMYPDGQKSNFCEVVEMETKDVKHLLEEWLKASGRQLQEDQKTRVLDAFKKCPEPLYMKLSFDTASKWRSYWPEKDTVLQETVEKSISQIFDDLEKMHGKLFVSRALGYLTVSRNGLAETELEDVLCCDEGAMKDVCTYWEPPHDNYRLPPLLLVRLKADMAHYLADREADGVCVFFWYHRQFIKVAEERYCKSKGMQLHEGLADYYTGAVAAGKPRPSQEASKRKGPVPRVSKPFPKRMLNQLPYHASMCKNKNLLKEYCLLNYTFLKDKLNESGIRSVLDDVSFARRQLADEDLQKRLADEDLQTVAETLQLSQTVLGEDPKQLPSQILGRIPRSANLQGLNAFLKACEEDAAENGPVFILPSQQLLASPGGQLVSYIWCKDVDVVTGLTGLAVRSDGTFAFASANGWLYVVDVTEGQITETKTDKEFAFITNLHLCCDDSIIVIEALHKILAYSCGKPQRGSSGKGRETEKPKIRHEWTVEDTQRYARKQICFCSFQRSTMVVFGHDEGAASIRVTLYNAKRGLKMSDIELRETAFHSAAENIVAPAGSERFAVMADKNTVWVVDVERRQFVGTKQLDLDDNTVIKSLAVFSDKQSTVFVSTSDNCFHFISIIDKGESTLFGDTQVYKGITTCGTSRLHVTTDGKMLYHPDDQMIHLWDITQSPPHVAVSLRHPTGVIDVTTTNMKTFITIADDAQIRIWDVHRGVAEGKSRPLEYRKAKIPASHRQPDHVREDGALDVDDTKTVQSEKEEISQMVSLQDPGYVLLLSTKGDNSYFKVFDVKEGTVVREACISQAKPTMVQPMVQHKDGLWPHVVVQVNRRLKVVDLDKMAVITLFQGRLRQNTACLSCVQKTREIITVTTDGRDLKIYSVDDGKVKNIVKQSGQDPREISDLLVNKQGTLAVAVQRERHRQFLLFDLPKATSRILKLQRGISVANGRLSHGVTREEWEKCEASPFTSDGHCLVFTGECRNGKVPVFLNFKNDEQEEQLFRDEDAETLERCLLLDDTNILLIYKEGVLGLFDKVKNKIHYWQGVFPENPRIYLDDDSKFFLTHTNWKVRVWKKTREADQFAELATFSLEDQLDGLLLLPHHGTKFLAATSISPNPIVFTIHGLKESSTGTTSKLRFFNEKPKESGVQGNSVVTLDLATDEGADDENDPDSSGDESLPVVSEKRGEPCNESKATVIIVVEEKAQNHDINEKEYDKQKRSSSGLDRCSHFSDFEKTGDLTDSLLSRLRECQPYKQNDNESESREEAHSDDGTSSRDSLSVL